MSVTYHIPLSVREAVQISMMPWGGVQKLNRCMEWGQPRIPVLSATGGDDDPPGGGVINPRPDWSRTVMEKIREGNMKRIKYWVPDDDVEEVNVQPGPTKRPRLEEEPAWDPGAALVDPTPTPTPTV